ncbi:MAG: hypothetical protein GX430_11765 [Treponema sp.]|nr:hypothetical protein [Treponema sp.]
MLDRAEDFLGRVTFVTGPEKHCGKTTFLNRALALVRAAGERPAFLSIGYDGEARDSLSAARKPSVPVAPGDVVVSAERFLRDGRILPEILDILPGSSAFGRICAARAHRPGRVVLVGPEGNEGVARALALLRDEGAARTVLVDGAINRITQVAAWPGARFVFVLRADAASLDKSARQARRLSFLASLPPAPADFGSREGELALAGPLTAAVAETQPETVRAVTVEDFTKVFLDDGELRSFRARRVLFVRNPLECAGIVAVLRAVSRDAFLSRLDEGTAARIAFNPYEVFPEAAA